MRKRDVKHLRDGHCFYCGRKADCIDHIVPRINAGTDSCDNLLEACQGCNSAKRAKDVEHWRIHGFLSGRLKSLSFAGEAHQRPRRDWLVVISRSAVPEMVKHNYP